MSKAPSRSADRRLTWSYATKTFCTAEPAGANQTQAVDGRCRVRHPAVYSWEELASRFQQIGGRNRNDEAYFFRHGATKYNEHNRVSGQHDTCLSEFGRNQAVALRDMMPRSVDLVVCSALKRTIQTMELSLPDPVKTNAWIVIDSRLNEVNLGVLQGRRRTWLPQFDKGDLDFAPEKGESYRGAARRVLSVIVDIFDLLAETGNSPRTAVIFCHAGVLRIISTLAHSMHSNEVFKTNPANGECLALPASQVRLPAYWNRMDEQHGAEKCHTF